MTRRALVLFAVGGGVGVVIGLVLLLKGQTGLGLFLLIGAPATGVVNVLLVRQQLARQRNGAPLRRGEPTGRMLAPARFPGGGGPWTGGASLSTQIGRMNASSPLAVLGVSGNTLELRLRPRIVGRLFGASPSLWRAGEVLTIYPVAHRLLKRNAGIAIESSTAPLAYFWTRQTAEVLAVLAAHGLPVDWTERSVTYRP